MATGDPFTPRQPPPRTPTKVWLAAGLLAALAGTSWVVWQARSRWDSGPSPDADPAGDGPFLNTRAGVRYTGDGACAGCHPDTAAAYSRHPMGRSLAPVASATPVERYDAAAAGGFRKGGWQFSVQHQGGRVFHRATRPGTEGAVQAEAEVTYALGSGERGRSYLTNRGGYLFQSPVSWFTQKGTWDLSPGFSEQTQFDRPVQPLCLYCHSNGAEAVEHTLNHYEEPLFKGGAAIGCERCHGPGELHVRFREEGGGTAGIDHTIVNPRHLEPALRDGVCQQCHLQGAERILRAGRRQGDYRPGLPLHDYWSVFVSSVGGETPPNPRREGTDQKAVGQVEQTRSSRCFQASGGKLGCTSCHDPHRLPASAERAAFYRGRCLQCHGDQGFGGETPPTRSSCGLPPSVRRGKDPEDSCVACHMPRFATSDIAHTAVTDHRIPRRAGEARAGGPRPAGEGDALVHFHADLVPAGDNGVSRDLGVVLAEQAWKARTPGLARRALPLLERAVRNDPEDVAAWEAQGGALAMLGRPDEALAVFQTALLKAPRRERTLVGAALSAERAGLRDAAVAYWERALRVNPWSTHAHAQLARLLGERGEWARALEECRAALRLNPGGAETRMFLVLCYLRTGDKHRARAEFDRVLALRPAEHEKLRRWFDEQAR